MKKAISFILKLLITIGSIIYVISLIDFAQVLKTLSATNLYFVFMGIFLSAMSLLLLAIRWTIILKIFYPGLKTTYLIGCYWIGVFFSLFLPSSLSGDLVRIYKINKKHGGLHKTITTGLIDRVIGFSSLVIFGSIIIIINNNIFLLKMPTIYTYFIILFWGSCLLFALMLSLIANNRWASKKMHRIPMIDKALIWIKECIVLMREHMSVAYKAYILSFSALLIYLVGILCFARAVGIEVSPLQIFLIASIVSIVVSIPISINGLGLQDVTYIYFLGHVGVASSHALSLSLVVHLTKYVVYLIGGVFYILEND